MSAVLQVGVVQVEHSEGVWHSAWLRFKRDRVGMVSAVIVIAFLLLIVFAALGLVAKNWQNEVGVANAPPTFIGPRPAEAIGVIEVPKGPNVDLSAVDPLAPKYKEWDERAAKFKTEEVIKAETLPMGGDRFGRDVWSKAVKGTQVSVFVGVMAALVATLIGTLLARADERVVHVPLGAEPRLEPRDRIEGPRGLHVVVVPVATRVVGGRLEPQGGRLAHGGGHAVDDTARP